MPRERSVSPQELQVQPADFWKWVWASLRPSLGWLFAGVGFLLLLVCYFGVSREVLVAKQLPYVVSGGLFGLAFVTLGSRLLLIEDLRRDSGRLDRLERMTEDLYTALLARPDSPVSPGHAETAGDVEDGWATDASAVPAARTPDRPVARRPPVDREVLVLRGGSSFHRGDCKVVAGKPGDGLPAADARARGLRACRLCQPLAVTA